MVAKHEEGECRYPSCGYNPEFNAACNRARKAYGECCGPCDGPCYIVSKHFAPGLTNSKTGNQCI